MYIIPITIKRLLRFPPAKKHATKRTTTHSHPSCANLQSARPASSDDFGPLSSGPSTPRPPLPYQLYLPPLPRLPNEPKIRTILFSRAQPQIESFHPSTRRTTTPKRTRLRKFAIPHGQTQQVTSDELLPPRHDRKHSFISRCLLFDRLDRIKQIWLWLRSSKLTR